MFYISAKNNKVKVDIQRVNGNLEEAGLGVEYGVELMKLAESFASGNEEALVIARERRPMEAGKVVLVEAVSLAANFQTMVRMVDVIGIPVDDINDHNRKQVWEEFGLKSFPFTQISL